jgi:hypothetical protein
MKTPNLDQALKGLSKPGSGTKKKVIDLSKKGSMKLKG